MVSNELHSITDVRRTVASRDGPLRKFHYSAEAEYFMNAAEVKASAEYFLPFLLISE